MSKYFSKSKELWPFLIASLFLAIGVVCYLFIYPNKFQAFEFYGFYFEIYKIQIGEGLILTLIYSLTSYCHAVFMTLYSISITTKLSSNIVYQWGFFWGVVDSVFEILQLINTRDSYINFNSHIMNLAEQFFIDGTFDILDLLFIWLGVISAFYLYRMNLCKIKKDNSSEYFSRNTV